MVVQCQVVSLVKEAPDSEVRLAGCDDIVAKLAHEGTRISRPDPARLFLLGNTMV